MIDNLDHPLFARLAGRNLMLPQYRGVVAWDFEYGRTRTTGPPRASATFLELLTGQRVELWEQFGPRPPFPTDPDWLWVSYHASAETGCHLALGWSIPATVLDLEAEFRCAPPTSRWRAARVCQGRCARTGCPGQTPSKSPR